jgi:hypothetical protein
MRAVGFGSFADFAKALPNLVELDNGTSNRRLRLTATP